MFLILDAPPHDTQETAVNLRSALDAARVPPLGAAKTGDIPNNATAQTNKDICFFMI